MNKKELEEYQHLECKAEIILKIYEKLDKEKSNIFSKSENSDMPKSSNKRLLSDVIEEIDSIAWKYFNLRLQALAKQSAIEDFIESLENPLHENILRLKYIEGYPWWKVARELNYSSTRHLRNVRDEILTKSKTQPPTAPYDEV